MGEQDAAGIGDVLLEPVPTDGWNNKLKRELSSNRIDRVQVN